VLVLALDINDLLKYEGPPPTDPAVYGLLDTLVESVG